MKIALTLSKVYAWDSEISESLSITRNLVHTALDEDLDISIHHELVDRLEDIAAREFISNEEKMDPAPGARTDVNDRIRQWATDADYLSADASR